MFGRHSDLLRQEVEVTANGMTYKGTLVEVTEEDVKLRGRTGWIIIPFQQVRRITKANLAPTGLDPMRAVGPGFYDESMGSGTGEPSSPFGDPHLPAGPFGKQPLDAPPGPFGPAPTSVPVAEPIVVPETTPLPISVEAESPVFETPVESWAAPPAPPAAPARRPASFPAIGAVAPRSAPAAAGTPVRPPPPPRPSVAAAVPARPAPAQGPGRPPGTPQAQVRPAAAVPPGARPVPAAPAAPAPPRASAPPNRPAPPAKPPAPPRPPASAVVPGEAPPAVSSVEDLFRQLKLPKPD